MASPAEIDVDDRSEASVADMRVTPVRSYGINSRQDSNEDPSETVCSSPKISG